jgi:hypothetical protein
MTAFEEQIRDDMAFRRLLDPLEQQFGGPCRGDMRQRFQLVLPLDQALDSTRPGLKSRG